MGITARGLAAALSVSALGAALLVGCGDDDASRDESPATSEELTSTTTEEPADPEEAEREAVIDALLAAEEATLVAVAPPTPNPDHPDLLATHTGPMLEERQLLASGLAANGWAIRLPEDTKFRHEVQSVEFDPDDPDVAFLTTCAVDDGQRYVVATGELIAEGLFTIEFSDAMQRIDGVWKLAERREENRWEGEAGCAVD